MEACTLVLALRADGPLDDAAVDAVAGTLRPHDEALCVWRDEANRHLLRVSAECVAVDLEGALELGHALAAETIGLGAGLTAEEVVAMNDEEQLVWRARP